MEIECVICKYEATNNKALVTIPAIICSLHATVIYRKNEKDRRNYYLIKDSCRYWVLKKSHFNSDTLREKMLLKNTIEEVITT